MRCSLLLLLLAVAPARAATPPWVAACVERFEKTAARLDTKTLKFSTGKVKIVAEDPPLFCGQPTFAVEYETSTGGAHYGAAVGTTQDEGGDGKWKLSSAPGQPARAWARRATRQLGRVATDAPVGKPVDASIQAFRAAVDVCWKEMVVPAGAPPDDPQWTTRCRAQPAGTSTAWVDVCVTAERAAREIERMCTWEDESVGVGMRTGRGYIELRRIIALSSDALPILQRLAASKNPLARAAAARGFGLLHSEAARLALNPLAADPDPVPTRVGDKITPRPVSAFAKDALKTYPK